MKKIFLYGHTGSINHGCEAIVRSTADILNGLGVTDISLFSDDFDTEKKFDVDSKVQLISYKKKNLFSRAVCKVSRKFLKWSGPDVFEAGREIKDVKKEDLVFIIGGDTYCYSRPLRFITTNKAIKKRKIKNVFWGCSVDEKALNDEVLIKDINSYSFVVARETLSYEILKKVLKDHSKLYLACDPAFNLNVTPTELPQNFLKGNTVGINISPLFFKESIIEENVYTLLDFILEKTDMNIVLVPHVYDVKNNLQDIACLKKIAQKYSSVRIAIVDKDLSCEQLKYIISNCRFFVGARTHSMIAAYSTGVPALALSYSIKSRGLAKDLYGDEELLVKYKEVTSKDEFRDAFEKLMRRENELLKVYAEKLVPYKQTIIEVAKTILNK